MKTSRKTNRQAQWRSTKTRTGLRSGGTVSTPRIRSILVPIDFSEPSIKALKYAAAFARHFGAKLTLLNVVEPAGTPDFIAAFPLVMENEQLTTLAEEHLRKLPSRYNLSPKLVEKTLVRSGAAFNEIAAAARSLRTDLIIIATHGHTGLKHLVLGSTAERVVRHAPCPVFVVRENERELLKD